MKILKKLTNVWIALFISQMAMADPISNQTLAEKIKAKKPNKYTFVKDAPIYAFKITEDNYDKIAEKFKVALGKMDETKYPADYLHKNIGSVVALQMNGNEPDFYVIGKESYEANYVPAEEGSVEKKNSKYHKKFENPNFESLLHDSQVIPVLKTVPTQMIRMSELGYKKDDSIEIESPWGTQTKPAGKDAYLVWDKSEKKYYMVNSDDHGLPASYVEGKYAHVNQMIDKLGGLTLKTNPSDHGNAQESDKSKKDPKSGSPTDGSEEETHSAQPSKSAK